MRSLPAAVIDQLAFLQANDGVELAARCRDWLAKLPATAELIETNGVDLAGPVTIDDLAQIRNHLASLKMRAVEPPSRQAQGRTLKRRQDNDQPPACRTLDGRFEVNMPNSVLGMLCWLLPNQLATALGTATRTDLDRQIATEKTHRMALAR